MIRVETIVSQPLLERVFVILLKQYPLHEIDSELILATAPEPHLPEMGKTAIDHSCVLRRR